ncbi:MAG: alpha/beta hydrolase, partial [Flavitalea sp.]
MKHFLICLFFLTAVLYRAEAQTSSQEKPVTGIQVGIFTSNIANKWIDLSYAGISQAQKLDIYLPDSGQGPFPVIIAIHGGAFKFGDKADDQLVPMLEGLRRGYAVASINYRMSGEAKSTQLIQDVKAAVRWLRANAGTYKLNPNKMAAWGSSAGGHLSSLLGVSGDIPAFDDPALGNAKESARVEAVVDWFGPVNFLTMDDEYALLGARGMQHSVAGSPESEVIGSLITAAPDKVKAFNPATYITKDDPPFFIQHGSKDPLIPYLQSLNFAYNLYSVLGRDKVNVELLEGEGHGGSQFNAPQNLDKVFAFL